MNKKKKISILTDVVNESTNQKNEEESLNAIPSLGEIMGKAKYAAIEVDTETLTKNIIECYDSFVEVASKLKNRSDAVKIDSIQFTISISSSGQASLLSAISVNSQSNTGITFNLKLD